MVWGGIKGYGLWGGIKWGTVRYKKKLVYGEASRGVQGSIKGVWGDIREVRGV